VVGPDEFHTAYPDSKEPGLNNNAYTNLMASWVIKSTLDVLNRLSEKRIIELLEKTGIKKEDVSKWKDISQKMYIPFHDGDIISQFEGYEKLKEIDWDKYRLEYGNIQRLDRILKAENDSPNNYKVGKQADVLMLFYLFSAEALKEMFEYLGYSFDPHTIIPENIKYYTHRSSFGSSLSRLVYSWVLARQDRDASWTYFLEALKSDFEDIQGGTTPEGIHLGAMSGTVDMMQRCYTGIEIRDDVLWINPMLPKELSGINMRIRYRGNWLQMQINPRNLVIELATKRDAEIVIGFYSKIYKLKSGQKIKFDIPLHT